MFTTAITGLVTIRAYKKIPFFRVNLLIANEKSANITFTYLTASRWMNIRFDMAVLIVSFSATCLALSFRGIILATLLTFTLQNLTDVVVHFSVSMRMLAEL